jgi:ribosomal protein L11 methyltransferase
VPAAEAEIARARLLPLEPCGFEEMDLGTDVELAVYVDAEGEERVRAEFGHARATPVEPGWEERWRAFHRPIRVAGLWIGPPWEKPPPGEPTVVVDPGRAFGTGAHPTTRACIELLAGAARGSVLDAGCGSGVLAVAAARLGFGPVYAVDDDPLAVQAAQRTATENGVHVNVSAADVLLDPLPRVDLLVANIELSAVEALLARRPASTAITSGYLSREMPTTATFGHVERLQLEGWAADRCRAI